MQKLTKVQEFRFKLFPKDLQTVRSFYKEELGFEIKEEWSSGVMFDIGGGVIELLVPKDNYRPVAGVGLSLKVDDVWSLWAKLRDKEYVVRDLTDNSWGDTSFRIVDPEGLQITFFS